MRIVIAILLSMGLLAATASASMAQGAYGKAGTNYGARSAPHSGGYSGGGYSTRGR
jgi:hypothetical protein